MDNCSSGGRRLDLEMVKMTDENMNVSDCELTGKELSELTVTIKEKRGSLLVEYSAVV